MPSGTTSRAELDRATGPVAVSTGGSRPRMPASSSSTSTPQLRSDELLGTTTASSPEPLGPLAVTLARVVVLPPEPLSVVNRVARSGAGSPSTHAGTGSRRAGRLRPAPPVDEPEPVEVEVETVGPDMDGVVGFLAVTRTLGRSLGSPRARRHRSQRGDCWLDSAMRCVHPRRRARR
jgi:hypothetical protein